MRWWHRACFSNFEVPDIPTDNVVWLAPHPNFSSPTCLTQRKSSSLRRLELIMWLICKDFVSLLKTILSRKENWDQIPKASQCEITTLKVEEQELIYCSHSDSLVPSSWSFRMRIHISHMFWKNVFFCPWHAYYVRTRCLAFLPYTRLLHSLPQYVPYVPYGKEIP